MKSIIALGAACAAILSGCATKPFLVEPRTGKLSVLGATAVPGGHCESSAILNALVALGYGVTEADIAGGGAAPGFLYTTDGFPFIGTRNERMRENFFEASGIPWGRSVPADESSSWAPIFALLDRGLPVMLRVDMRWLPYLYGGKYGPAYMSFGWHWICLLGVDFDSSEAFVSDTSHATLQRITLADLDKARGSKLKQWPPMREYAWIEPRPEGWKLDPDALARASLGALLTNYDGSGGWDSQGGRASLSGLAGLEAFPSRLEEIGTYVNAYTLGPAYRYMADSIERNGTGGSGFRRLYRDFLAARSRDCLDPGLKASCAALVPFAEDAMEAWSGLATSFERSGSLIASAKGDAARTATAGAAKASAEAARRLFAAEKTLRDRVASAFISVSGR